jgi:predicted Ser/Thr protein kinase
VSLGLSRANLAARTLRVLQRGGRRNPDVYLVESDAGAVVVKDFAPRGPLVRAWLGPWLQRRELRAYRVLAGHPAVPRCLGALDRRALVVEYRPGRRLSRRLAGRISGDFVDALAAAVAAMHERGVAHLDLRHRSNVLVDEGGRPVLLDFASAVCLRPGGAAARWLLPVLAWFDRRALAKWRARLSPPTPGDERAVTHP